MDPKIGSAIGHLGGFGGALALIYEALKIEGVDPTAKYAGAVGIAAVLILGGFLRNLKSPAKADSAPQAGPANARTEEEPKGETTS